MSIKWSDLSAKEKDRLVAEKVMGWKPGLCDGGIGEQSVSPDGWYCYKCGYEGCWGDDYEHEQIPPAYSTSMELAWKLTEQERCISVRVERDHPRGAMTECELWVQLKRYKNVGSAVASTPQEAICLAALNAWGIEVE